MPIQFDNFDQQKIDRLKSHLTAMAAKNQAKPFEIYVDALKAVPKTDVPEDFDGYEDYMTADTEQIRILIYNTAASPRNDQYVFLLKARNREEATGLGLSGTPPQSFTRSSLSDWRKVQDVKSVEAREIFALKRENAELQRELDECEKLIEKLDEIIEEAKANGNKIGGVHIGEIVSVALEGLVRRNTDIIAQIPLVSGLAGIIEKDNSRLETPAEPTEASFKKKEETSAEPALTAMEKEFVGLFREMQTEFDHEQMGMVIDILDALSQDKTQLQPVLELLEENTNEEETQKKT